MNTTLLSPAPDSTVDRTVDPTLHRTLAARTPRTSVTDRLALRAGLWLLLWSTRPSPPPPATHDVDAALARVNARARRERETAWLTQRRFTHPL